MAEFPSIALRSGQVPKQGERFILNGADIRWPCQLIVGERYTLKSDPPQTGAH